MLDALNTGMFPIKISIIEDSAIHLEWIKAEFHEDVMFEIVSADRLARKGLESIKSIQPNLVIVDFQLEDMTGLEVAKRIKAYSEQIKVFMITAHTEATIVERIYQDKNIDALAIKGSQYFGHNLKSAIKDVADGGAYLDPSLLNKLRESSKSNVISDLTKREFEIFIQSNAGKSDMKIAEDLCVELSYIKNLKSKITKKMKDANMDSLLRKLCENSYPDNIIL